MIGVHLHAKGRGRFVVVIVLVAMTLATGCLGRSPAVTQYLLGSDGLVDAEERAPSLAVLIGPVRLPAYLDRPQIARLEPGGEVDLDEFARWLGGFEKNFLRAISLGVARRLGSVKVTSYPSNAPLSFDARIRLHVDDMITLEGDALRVRIRWALIVEGSDTPASLFVMETQIPLEDDSSSAIVAAHDRALADLVGQIVDELTR